jgi:hypothetical protein
MIPQTKAGFSARQEEMQVSRERLLSLEEQVTRLKSYENHVSSRTLADLLDHELPDNLGYEINIFSDASDSNDKHEQRGTTRMPKEHGYTFSLSQIGFKTGSEQDEFITYHHSTRVKPSSEDPVDNQLLEEAESGSEPDTDPEATATFSDEARSEIYRAETGAQLAEITKGEQHDNCPNDGSFDSQKEGIKEGNNDAQLYSTPPQIYASQNNDLFFLTPPENEEKISEEMSEHHSCSPLLGMLELNLRERGSTEEKEVKGTTPNQEESKQNRHSDGETVSRDGSSPSEKGFLFAALSFLGHPTLGEEKSPDELHTHKLRKSWSNLDRQPGGNEGRIKYSPTDTFLHNPPTRKSTKSEEGLEIVAMGRLRTVGDALDADDERDDTTAKSGGLSFPHDSTDGVQVALYRP